MEAYIPQRFVSQDDLEQADGVATGKYTIGESLGGRRSHELVFLS